MGLSMKPGLAPDLERDVVELAVERLFELRPDLGEAVLKFVKTLPLKQYALIVLL